MSHYTTEKLDCKYCRLYTCNHCGFYSHYMDVIDDHILQEHGFDSSIARLVPSSRKDCECECEDCYIYKCGFCKFKTHDKSRLGNHIRKHHYKSHKDLW